MDPICYKINKHVNTDLTRNDYLLKLIDSNDIKDFVSRDD